MFCVFKLLGTIGVKIVLSSGIEGSDELWGDSVIEKKMEIWRAKLKKKELNTEHYGLGH